MIQKKKKKILKFLINNLIMLKLKSKNKYQKNKTENQYLLLYPVYFFFFFYFGEKIIFDIILNPDFIFFHYLVTFYNNIISILPFNFPEISEISNIPDIPKIPDIPNISDIPDKYKEILKNYKDIKIINEVMI